MSILDLIAGAIIGLVVGYLLAYFKSQKLRAELAIAKTQLEEPEDNMVVLNEKEFRGLKN
jgi:hypothetical protein